MHVPESPVKYNFVSRFSTLFRHVNLHQGLTGEHTSQGLLSGPLTLTTKKFLKIAEDSIFFERQTS